MLVSRSSLWLNIVTSRPRAFRGQAGRPAVPTPRPHHRSSEHRQSTGRHGVVVQHIHVEVRPEPVQGGLGDRGQRPPQDRSDAGAGNFSQVSTPIAVLRISWSPSRPLSSKVLWPTRATPSSRTSSRRPSRSASAAAASGQWRTPGLRKPLHPAAHCQSAGSQPGRTGTPARSGPALKEPAIRTRPRALATRPVTYRQRLNSYPDNQRATAALEDIASIVTAFSRHIGASSARS